MSEADSVAAEPDQSAVPDHATVAQIRPWRAPDVAPPAKGPLTAERLAEIEEQARSEGYLQGLEEGRREGEREMQCAAERLDRLLATLHPQAAVLDDVLLEQLGDLVIAIARQLVRRELRHQPGEIVRVAREALSVLPASDATARIYLHPEDIELVRHALNLDSKGRCVSLIEDVTLARGGARIETDVSVVDASIERRLNALAARVFGDDRTAACGEPEDGEPEDEE